MLLSWQELGDFYDNLTLHIVPGPRSSSYFVPFLIVIAALTVPPPYLSHRQIRWIVLPLFYTIQFYVWKRHQSFDVISMNGALHAFMLLGWYDVRQDFLYVSRLPSSPTMPSRGSQAIQGYQRDQPKAKRIRSNNNQESFRLEPYPKSLFVRLRWIGVLLGSMRMTDWQIGLPSHDLQQPSPIKSFSSFIKETITQIMLAYVLLDFTSPYMRSVGCGSGEADTTSTSLMTQASRSLILLAYFYAALSLFTALLPHLISIGALSLIPSLRSNSMASPLTWPSHLGPLSSIYSRARTSPSANLGLRAFWGIFWHQNMRHMTSTPGVALASMLRLSRGSKLRYMVIVASSFLWSGVVHMGVIPPEPQNTRLTCRQMRILVASFFWLQVVGIGFEELVEAVINLKKPAHDSTDKEGKSSRTDDEVSIQRLDNRFTLLAKRGVIMLWTVGFLAFTAWWTVLPVACEMGWLNIKLIPASFSEFLSYRT